MPSPRPLMWRWLTSGSCSTSPSPLQRWFLLISTFPPCQGALTNLHRVPAWSCRGQEDDQSSRTRSWSRPWSHDREACHHSSVWYGVSLATTYQNDSGPTSSVGLILNFSSIRPCNISQVRESDCAYVHAVYIYYICSFLGIMHFLPLALLCMCWTFTEYCLSTLYLNHEVDPIMSRTSHGKLFSINEEEQREALKGFYERWVFI